MKDILAAIQTAIDVVALGGAKAVILILIVNFVLALTVSWLIIRFLFNFIKEYNTNKDKALADKDKIIEDRTKKIEALVEDYTKLALQQIEKDNVTITAINDIRNLVLFSRHNGQLPPLNPPPVPTTPHTET